MGHIRSVCVGTEGLAPGAYDGDALDGSNTGVRRTDFGRNHHGFGSCWAADVGCVAASSQGCRPGRSLMPDVRTDGWANHRRTGRAPQRVRRTAPYRARHAALLRLRRLGLPRARVTTYRSLGCRVPPISRLGGARLLSTPISASRVCRARPFCCSRAPAACCPSRCTLAAGGVRRAVRRAAIV